MAHELRHYSMNAVGDTCGPRSNFSHLGNTNEDSDIAIGLFSTRGTEHYLHSCVLARLSDRGPMTCGGAC